MSTPVHWGSVAHQAMVARPNMVTPPGNTLGLGLGHSMGMGASPPIMLWEASSPGVALYRHAMSGNSAGCAGCDGLGQNGALAGLGAATVAAIVLFAIAANYQIGKAMAPSPAAEGKWAWGNAIGGTLFPPLTLGMAVYKNYFRD
jgi:hypothetical protein